jgi:hypothetical protein
MHIGFLYLLLYLFTCVFTAAAAAASAVHVGFLRGYLSVRRRFVRILRSFTTPFTCFTSTKEQILTQQQQVGGHAARAQGGTHFTCFTSRKVKILTQKDVLGGGRGALDHLRHGAQSGGRPRHYLRRCQDYLLY